MADQPDLDALIRELKRYGNDTGYLTMKSAREAATALAAERARADQAGDDLFEAEQRTLKQIARAGAAEARADQAEQRIADAPHDYHCNISHGISLPCDCWKSANG